MCVIFEPRPSSAGELPACKAKSAGMATGIMHTRRKADCRAGAGDRSPGWSAARSGTARPALTPFPDCAEPVIGRRFASTRWLHPGDGALVARRAKHPRGRQAARAKIFHFTEIRNWRMCRPSRLTKRGDLVSSLSRVGLAVDATASGARGQGQGGLLSVSPKLRAG